MSHKEKAMSLFTGGYNCAQAVFCAYCEELDIDLDTGIKLSASFGGGFGRLREVCGAVSGMVMAAGMLYAPADPNDAEQKAAHYARIQGMCNAFKQANGSMICRELLALPEADDSPVPAPRTEAYYKKRPCAELVGAAAEILDAYIANNPVGQ